MFSTVFAVLFLFWTESLFAVDGDPLVNDEDLWKIVKVLNGFIVIAATLMWLVTSFISMFLYPGWVNGTLFGLQDYLREMWILVSNIVYFIFAFVLIAIAFMNIIWKWEGTWELKQAMPKFIVWVLIVPFSWFLVQFILSISAILTVGVLTLPYDSFNDHELFTKALDNTELAGEKICKDIVISFNGDFKGANGEDNTTEIGSTDQDSGEVNEINENIKCKNEDGEVSIKELLTGEDEDGNASSNAAWLQNSVFGIISIYSYGILKIHDLDSLTWKDLETVETIADLVFKIVFDILFIAVYLLLMIALLLALFVRWVRLWIYMMLSPVFGLLYFFWKWSEWVGEIWDKFNIKEFIALALVPVYVSAALAFGLVFILVAGEGIKETNSKEDVLEAGWFSLTIIGAHASWASEKSVIAKLIVEIFGVVILWIAVMAALGASKTTKSVVEPIAAFGKSVWELAAKAPTYAPIIPTGNWERMGVAGLQTFGSNIAWWIDQKAKQRGTNFAQWFTNPSQNERGYQDLANKAVTSSANSSKAVKDIIWTWAITDLANSTAGLQWLVKHLEWVNTNNGATYWFSDKEEASKFINKLWTSKWDVWAVREALMELDKLATIQENSILWWETRITSVSQVDQYVWKLVSDSQAPWTSGNTTTNSFDFNIQNTKVEDATEAANAYIANKDKYSTTTAVESDLKANGITDSTVIAQVLKAYQDAVDKD